MLPIEKSSLLTIQEYFQSMQPRDAKTRAQKKNQLSGNVSNWREIKTQKQIVYEKSAFDNRLFTTISEIVCNIIRMVVTWFEDSKFSRMPPIEG